MLDWIQRRRVENVAFPAGARIMTEGEFQPAALHRGQRLGDALQGAAQDGRRQILSFILPGDVIGFQAQFFDSTVTSVEAVTDVSLCVVPYQDVAGLSEDRPEIAFPFRRADRGSEARWRSNCCRWASARRWSGWRR